MGSPVKNLEPLGEGEDFGWGVVGAGCCGSVKLCFLNEYICGHSSISIKNY